MKASDLRIGNWVITDQTEIVCDVLCDCINTHNHELLPIGEIEPIPLTEDWLVMFGFKKHRYHYRKGKLDITLEGRDAYNELGRVYYNAWAILDKQPDYVHQLQNLYHALTGKELEIVK